MLNTALLVLLVLLNVADLVTTLKGLKRDDTTEGNLTGLYRKKPRFGRLLAAKLVMIGLGVLSIVLTAPTAWAFLGVLDAAGLVIIYNNIRGLQGKTTIF